MLPTRDPLQTQGHIETESEGMEKYIPCKWKSKESWSSNSHIRKNRLQNKEYYKRQRRTLHNDLGINPKRRYNNLNIYVPNIGAPQYIRQILTAIKGEVDSNTIIVGEFNTLLSPKDRSSKMKINKETQALNDTLNKMDLIDINRKFHPKKQKTRLLSSQVLMEHSPGQIISWVTNQALVNLRKLKSYHVSFPTTML